MRVFFKYIVVCLSAIIIGLFILEFMYASIYNNSDFIRNKFQLALKGPVANYDLVVLGSSRANNHIDTGQIQKLGLTTFNFGRSGASMEDNYVLLKLLTSTSKIKNIWLELDLNIQSEAYAKANRINILPYITKSKVLSDYYLNEINNFKTYKHIPFYRFSKFDSRLGFREVFLNAIYKKSKHLGRNGFTPLYGISSNLFYDLSLKTPKKNKYYEAIKELCKVHKINLISFTTPICKQTLGREYFEKIPLIYPEVISFENVITEDKYFSTCGHMNEDGAKVFTSHLIKNIL